ncbi:hypothetical protein W02_24770 [Nitrospira sp. KM1]|nr:hypothetical protein W02_24770 [Nitrospira sp. KM1]
MSKIMEDEVSNRLLLTKPLDLSVRMVQFLPVLLKHQPLNAHHPIGASQPLEFPTQSLLKVNPIPRDRKNLFQSHPV